jgi:hypothetical protein
LGSLPSSTGDTERPPKVKEMVKLIGAGLWGALRRAGTNVVASFEPLSKLAQIVAIVIAGFWSYHIYQTTEEGDVNPEVSVSAEAFPYSKDARFMVVRIREKNVGKVPIYLDSKSLSVTIKLVPDALKSGYVDLDRQKPTFETKDLFARYGEDGVELSAGVELEDVAEFVVAPGLYHIEANLDIPDDDSVNAFAVLRVE